MASSANFLSQGRKYHVRYGLVIVLAIAALTCSLATRTFHISNPHGTAVSSAAAQAMRQHLNRDAAKWTRPVTVYEAVLVLAFYPRIAPASPPIPSVLFDEHLYNRPPPAVC